MSDIDSRIAAAASARLLAKAQLTETLTSVQQRLDPRHLADQAMVKARARGHLLADQAGQYVKDRQPALITAAVAMIALVFRRDIAAIIQQFLHDDLTDQAAEPSHQKEA